MILAAAILILQVETETPVLAALKYLARHQSPDGSWGGVSCGCPANRKPREFQLMVDAATQSRLERLVEKFREDDIEVREEAQSAILRFGQEAVPVLLAGARSPDAEVQVRCAGLLDRLHPCTAEPDVEATGLAVLAFLGAGYSHLSRDEHEGICFGTVLKKALQWLITLQKKDGTFGRVSPAASASAAIALSEAYGMTGSQVIKGPAEKAVAAAFQIDSRETYDLILKVILFCSAQLSELGGTPSSHLVEIGKILEGREDTLARAGAALMKIWGKKQPAKDLGKRLLTASIDRGETSTLWIVDLAVFHHLGPGTDEWRKWHKTILMELAAAQATNLAGCERGSWERGSVGDRIKRTAQSAMMMEHYRRESVFNK